MKHIALCLKDVFLGQKTGRLICRTSEDQRIFYFQDGVLLQAQTDAPGEEFLDILVRRGRVTMEQADQFGLQASTTRSLGEELLERGLIDREVFFETLMAQAREAVLNCFTAEKIEFSFEETARLPIKGLESNLSLPRLIAEGVRLMPDLPEVRSFLAGRVALLRGAPFLEELRDPEKRLLELVDGRVDTAALLAASGAEPAFFWKTLFLFYGLDLIDLKAPEAEAPAPDRAAESPSTQDLLSEVQILKEAMGSLSHHQLLNIPADASLEEIKKAYFEMARRFHPDSFGSDVPPEMKTVIFEVFNALTRAYDVLTARARRKEGTVAGTVADQSLASVIRRAEERSEGKDRANVLFRRGQMLYDEGKFGGAAALFQESARLDPGQADYWLWLARSEAKVPTLVKKAEEDFQTASRLAPENPEPVVGLGMLYKREGLLNLAARQFEKAGEIDPAHPIVRRELGATRKLEKKRGLFGLKK
jgi:tetratricopeptide (TPR) repeat protein